MCRLEVCARLERNSAASNEVALHWVVEGSCLESAMIVIAGVDINNNAVLPLRRDNERYAVAVTPSATINTACLINDGEG